MCILMFTARHLYLPDQADSNESAIVMENVCRGCMWYSFYCRDFQCNIGHVEHHSGILVEKCAKWRAVIKSLTRC